MFLKFCKIPVWPSRAQVDQHMPADLKDKYLSTTVIIDCAEISYQMPQILRLNSEIFSLYKNHTTLKGLVGISPGGATTFISQPLLASSILAISLTETLSQGRVAKFAI